MFVVTAILSCVIKIRGLFKSTEWRHFENVKSEALWAWRVIVYQMLIACVTKQAQELCYADQMLTDMFKSICSLRFLNIHLLIFSHWIKCTEPQRQWLWAMTIVYYEPWRCIRRLDSVKVCSINSELSKIDLCSACRVYLLSRGAWIN